MLLYHKPTPLTTSSLLLTCFGFGFEEKQRWDVMNHRTLSQEAAITLPRAFCISMVGHSPPLLKKYSYTLVKDKGKNLHTSRYHHTPLTARAGGKNRKTRSLSNHASSKLEPWHRTESDSIAERIHCFISCAVLSEQMNQRQSKYASTKAFLTLSACDLQS